MFSSYIQHVRTNHRLPHLLIRACILAAIVWDVSACFRSSEHAKTCNCTEMETTITTLHDQLQQKIEKCSEEKNAKKKELSACIEKLSSCQSSQFDTDGRLDQTVKKLELSNSTLIQRERELQKIRDKLSKCELDIPPTVESVRTLHQQVKQHQPIIEKKDAEIAEKDRQIALLSQKVGSLERELAICQTEQKAAKVAIEEFDLIKKELEYEKKENRRTEKYNIVGGMSSIFLFIIILVMGLSFRATLCRFFVGIDHWGPPLRIQNGRPNNIGDVVGNAGAAIAQGDNQPFVDDGGLAQPQPRQIEEVPGEHEARRAAHAGGDEQTRHRNYRPIHQPTR